MHTSLHLQPLAPRVEAAAQASAALLGRPHLDLGSLTASVAARVIAPAGGATRPGRASHATL
jgi:hypothetical protein